MVMVPLRAAEVLFGATAKSITVNSVPPYWVNELTTGALSSGTTQSTLEDPVHVHPAALAATLTCSAMGSVPPADSPFEKSGSGLTRNEQAETMLRVAVLGVLGPPPSPGSGLVTVMVGVPT